ncbi:protein containing Integrase, catalytic core, phage domain protein [human gut metagenome]|mgnify:FL=1|uniref:Protein containing Integrase, catalytic core, phage domain protein n=1 Tax=human gut metagenome TaxID=408170 RepID=K1TKN4_9ZZZZ
MCFLLIYKGANIITVSKFLGHTKIEETLNTYTHLYKNAFTDITSLIDDMNEARINS